MCSPVSHSPLYYPRCLYYHKLLICLLRLSFRHFCSFRLKPHWRISVASWNSIKWFRTGRNPCIKLANNYWLIRYCCSCRCESLLWFFFCSFFTVGLITLPRRCVFVCILELPNSDVCQFTSCLDWNFESFCQSATKFHSSHFKWHKLLIYPMFV